MATATHAAQRAAEHELRKAADLLDAAAKSSNDLSTLAYRVLVAYTAAHALDCEPGEIVERSLGIPNLYVPYISSVRVPNGMTKSLFCPRLMDLVEHINPRPATNAQNDSVILPIDQWLLAVPSRERRKNMLTHAYNRVGLAFYKAQKAAINELKARQNADERTLMEQAVPFFINVLDLVRALAENVTVDLPPGATITLSRMTSNRLTSTPAYVPPIYITFHRLTLYDVAVNPHTGNTEWSVHLLLRAILGVCMETPPPEFTPITALGGAEDRQLANEVEKLAAQCIECFIECRPRYDLPLERSMPIQDMQLKTGPPVITGVGPVPTRNPYMPQRYVHGTSTPSYR